MIIKDSSYKVWFNELADAAFVFKGDGQVFEVNLRACNLLGYSAEELLRKNMNEVDPGAVVSGVFGISDYACQSKWPYSSRRLLERKDGFSEPVEVRISSIGEEEDTYIAVARDVTEDISLERQLQHAQKMEAIGTLAGGIAHDFNNILAAILGYGQIVRDQLPSDSPIRKDVDQILNGGIRATDLVKQILTFSRQGKEEFKPIHIQYLIKEVLKLLRASLPATIDLQQELDMGCGVVEADTSGVHQVVMNLCTNAKHAIGDNAGTLFVGLSEEIVGNIEDIEAAPIVESGKYVVLTVRDTGCGMDENTIVRVFEPFFSTKDKDTGTGLGMAIVHGIVKKHNGDITVVSRPETGTTFKVYFPVASTEQPSLVAKESDFSSNKGDERIMVVDDEPAVLITLKRMLGKDGYDVTTFNSSMDAAVSYRENPEYYDIVITDMTMPEMTGLELAREMIAFRGDLPVLLMSGFGDAMDREKMKNAGIHDFLVKPFSHRELTAMVRKVFDNG